MENPLHEDKLDDYVRGSFEGYEEDPATDMWSRIEQALPPAAPAAPVVERVAMWPYRWQAAAAAIIVLLLSTLVCEHLYYSRRIDLLTQENTPQPTTPAPAGVQPAAALPPSTPSAAVQQQHLPESAPIQPPKAATPASAESATTATPSIAAHTSSSPASSTLGLKSTPYSSRISEALPPASPMSTAPPNLSPTDPAPSAAGVAPSGKTISPTDASPQPQPDAPPAGLPAASWTQARLPLGLPSLAPKPLTLLPSVRYAVVSAVPVVKPHRAPSAWYAGAQVAWLNLQERSRPLMPRPGMRPIFRKEQNETQSSPLVGLRIGKKITPRLALESGLAYQRTEQTATHQPRFRFAEGIASGILGSRTYSYDLSTYGGTAEVSLRMEPSTPGNPPAPDEAVPLKITTSERIDLLRIPVVANYRLGGRRLTTSLKAGLVANVTLKHELDVSARVSQSSRFRPVDGQDGYSLQLKHAGSVAVGYLAAAGAEYRISKHWSAIAEPVLLGDFARKDQSGQALPTQMAWGLNAGVQVYF